jgi:phage baseplate assembly protein W
MTNFKFKSSGKKFGSKNTTSSEIESIIEERKIPLGIAMPLRLAQDNKSTLYTMNFDQVEQIRQNLKNLLLTSPGERLGRYDLGAGLRNITFEMITQNNNFESRIMELMQSSVERYMPYVVLKTLTSENIRIETASVNRPLAKLILEVNFDIPLLNAKNQKIMLVLYIAG